MLACAAWYGWRCWWLQMPDRGPSDFQFYYEATRHVWHGESPYLEGGYVYSPLLALLLAPLARFDYFTARWVWFVVSHAAFLGAGFLLWRALGCGRAALCSVALVWAAGGAAEDGFGLGQVDAVLVLACVAAMVSGGVARAVAAAGGFALKFIPGILALLERRWRGLALIGALMAVLMVGPWAVVRFGLHGPAAPASTGYLAGTPCVLSWGLPSVAVRFADWPVAGKLPADWTFGYDLPKVRLSGVEKGVSWAVAGAVILMGLALWGRPLPYGRGSGSDVVTGSALICLAVVASPISWWHYPVLEYPAIAILLTTRRRVAGAVAGAACYLLPNAALKHYFHLQERWPDFPWVIQFWTAIPAIAALFLFWLMCRIVVERTDAPL